MTRVPSEGDSCTPFTSVDASLEDGDMESGEPPAIVAVNEPDAGGVIFVLA